MRRIRPGTRRNLLANLIDRGPMLTPLIDIMFLVLIFFMVNNSPAQRSLGVQPPYMPSAPLQETEPSHQMPGVQSAPTVQILLVAVRPDLSFTIQLQEQRQGQQDGHILQQWQGRPAGGEALAPLQGQLRELQSKRQLFSQIQRIRLRADHSLSYGTVITICDLLNRWQLPLDLDVSQLPLPS